jgi:NADH:ubiquinone reductase (H+-translocating)
VWATGQRPAPFVAKLGLDLDPSGRVVVDDQLRVPGREHIFVLGDAAAVPDPTGVTCPPLPSGFGYDCRRSLVSSP